MSGVNFGTGIKQDDSGLSPHTRKPVIKDKEGHVKGTWEIAWIESHLPKVGGFLLTLKHH